MSSVVSFRVEDAQFEGLDQLVKATHRDRPYHLRQALSQYLEQQSWQVASIQAGLADAEAGNLIEHADIEAKWGS